MNPSYRSVREPQNSNHDLSGAKNRETVMEPAIIFTQYGVWLQAPEREVRTSTVRENDSTALLRMEGRSQ